jgi:hypothetical protein
MICSSENSLNNLNLEIGYKTKQGLLYLGKNSSEEHLYVPQEDTPHAMNFKQAKEWLENKNSTHFFGISNWDFPTGHGSSTDELDFFAEAYFNSKLNKVFNFKNNFYGSKTPYNEHKYYIIMATPNNPRHDCFHMNHKDNPLYYRPVLRMKDYIL